MHPAFRGIDPTENQQVKTYFDRLGTSDEQFIDDTADAIAQGAQLWPSGGQRYRAVRTENSLILASDGLADLGCELYMEMMHGNGWLYDQIRLNWQIDVLRAAASVIARLGTTPQTPTALMVPAPPSAPSSLTTGTSMPVLIGMEVPGRPAHTDDDSVTLLPVTPITPSEYRVIEAEDSAEKIAAKRAQMRFHHITIDSDEVNASIIESL